MNNHSYSILGIAKIVQNDGDNITLMCLRNPFAKCEWVGDWSDGSRNWTSQIKSAVGYVEHQDMDEGIFWVSLEEWRESFDYLYVCKV